MQENLVIVESPAKAKTIEKFLGKDFVVKSSFGHIRDLSKKDLGVNLDKDYEPVYEIPSDKRKVVEELSSLAKKTKTVWLASDEDREGEAIAWHLAEVLGLPIHQTKRIVFHEITKPAILAAIESPRTIDMNLVNAQHAAVKRKSARPDRNAVHQAKALQRFQTMLGKGASDIKHLCYVREIDIFSRRRSHHTVNLAKQQGIHQRAGQPSFAVAGGACDDAVLAIADPIATGQSFNQSAVQIAVRRVQSIFNTCVRIEAS